MVNRAEQIKGLAKTITGTALAGVSITFYPVAFAIGTTSAIVGTCIVGAGFFFQSITVGTSFISQSIAEKNHKEKDTQYWKTNLRRLGSFTATFGICCMLSPGIGISLATEGLYSATTGKPTSITSSLSKAIYQTGVNFRKGIPLIGETIIRSLKGNINPKKDIDNLEKGFDNLIGIGKVIAGACITGASIALYPLVSGIGTISATIGACVIATSLIIAASGIGVGLICKSLGAKKEYGKNWGINIRHLGSAAVTFGVCCIASPVIGIGLATEGLYSSATGKPASITSSLSKAVYQTGVNFKKGIPLIGEIITSPFKGNMNPRKELEERLNIIPNISTPLKVHFKEEYSVIPAREKSVVAHSISTEVINKGRKAVKSKEITSGGSSNETPTASKRRTYRDLH